MKFQLKIVAVSCSVALLGACGGGGDDGVVDSGGDTTLNSLAKYAGTYYACEDHSKEVLVATAAGTSSLSITVKEEIYENADCTGTIVGTYRLPEPILATYEYQTTVSLPPITILPTTDTVDRVNITAPSMTAQLTGSGVSGACVSYSSGNICYDSLALPASTETGAVYKNGDYLLTFTLTNGVLEAESIYSKNTSFNYDMLLLD